ncbi:UNVERIFIED_CONTAM: hypothetical protein Sangu_2796200 [Sesamum angustifolium]|uniref:Uncharacterized protein n=1 Tax=Sesamum angustifolium TaxID=2727405 RepID=A0AAW2ISS9_9LAMI
MPVKIVVQTKGVVAKIVIFGGTVNEQRSAVVRQVIDNVHLVALAGEDILLDAVDSVNTVKWITHVN